MPKLSKQHKALPAYDLKAARESRNLSQVETAQMLFTTQSSVARWEADGDMPQIHREYWRLYWLTQKPAKAAKGATKTPAK